MNQFEYIDLSRTFLPISKDIDSSTDIVDIEESDSQPSGFERNWTELLEERRVVILSEAGAGKTEEVRNIAHKLELQGRFSFFLRLEYLAENDFFFEVGDKDRFDEWMGGYEKGWFFLDSVDEARLSSPKSFAKAVRYISLGISTALQRAHIFITSRVSSWRFRTDYLLFKNSLPYYSPSDSERKKIVDISIYKLSDLSDEQVKNFAAAQGLGDLVQFLQAIKSSGIRGLVARPADLLDVIAYWQDRRSIGSRLSHFEYNIRRRLNEWKQDFRDSNPADYESLIYGSKKLAVALTLLQKQTICIPDGDTSSNGIDSRLILTEWNDQEINNLLTRPIFDEAIYGTVRFHHRAIREYLAAKWFYDSLLDGAPRRYILNLFIREHYGEKVIVPTTRHLLPWLAIWDDQIRGEILDIDPELILEGGDPSSLSKEVRLKLLEILLEKVNQRLSQIAFTNPAGLSSLVSSEMADDLNRLFIQYKESSSIASLLLDVIWMRNVKKASSLAKEVAEDPTVENYTLKSAIRAVGQVGSDSDRRDVLNAFIETKVEIDRGVFSELVKLLRPSKDGVAWLLGVLPRIGDGDHYSSHTLKYTFLGFIKELELSHLMDLVEGLIPILSSEPLIEHDSLTVCQRFEWLLEMASAAVQKLIENKHPASLRSSCCFVLIQVPIYEYYERNPIPNNFLNLIQGWQSLKRNLFWECVAYERKQNPDSQITYYPVDYLQFRYCQFTNDDFELILDDIENQPLPENQLIALDVAIYLYDQNERPKNWKQKLEKLVKGEEMLQRRLNGYFAPQVFSKEQRKLLNANKRAVVKREKEEKRAKEEELKSRQFLRENYNLIRDSGLDKGIISNQQHYLYDFIANKDTENLPNWIPGSWKYLIEDFGEEVALAYRDHVISFWRNYTPTYVINKRGEKSLPLGVFYGLSGLNTEFEEFLGLATRLSDEELELALRYALFSYGGFPAWFREIYRVNSELTVRFLTSTILSEAISEPNWATGSIIQKVFRECEWLWPDLAQAIFDFLEKNECIDESADYLLKIVEGGASISDERLANLAETRYRMSSTINLRAIWIASWIGTNPSVAINKLKTDLELFDDKKLATDFAMNVVLNIIGIKHPHGGVRTRYKEPQFLAELIKIMYSYIKKEDDYERGNRGFFTYTLRDEAQQARDQLLPLLKETPGKATYTALRELSVIHPDISIRPYLLQYARKRATLDAALQSFTGKDVLEFMTKSISTPSNHRELYELIKLKLIDLKHDLENGDTSVYRILQNLGNNEKLIRNWVGNELRSNAIGKYSLAQEDELSDDKRPDLRIFGNSFDGPVPLEVKLANNWSGSVLLERLENQLCGDYLRDERSQCGIYLLISQKDKTYKLPRISTNFTFSELVEYLDKYGKEISCNYSDIEDITVVGIDLTKRGKKKRKEESQQ